MPLSAILIYLEERHNEYLQREELMRLQVNHYAYTAECLWVLAVGRNFIDGEKEPTMPRWQEIVNPKKEEKPIEITKDDLKAYFRSLKSKRQSS